MAQKSPLMIALGLASLVVLGFGAALYIQEDRKQSALSSASFPDTPPTDALAPYMRGPMSKLSAFTEREALYDYPIILADGSTIALNDIKDKAMLINLWASWCAPCRAEMKELAHLETEVGNEHFTVVAINVDYGGIEQARETLAEWGVEGLDLYADPTLKTAQEIALGRLPMSILVDRKGRMIGKYLGALKWDAPEGIALFEALRDGKI